VGRFISRRSLALEMSGQLMEVDADGKLVVRYSDRFVTLLREVSEHTPGGRGTQGILRKPPVTRPLLSARISSLAYMLKCPLNKGARRDAGGRGGAYMWT